MTTRGEGATTYVSRSEVVELLGVEEGFLLRLEEEAIVVVDPAGRYGPEAVERVRLCQTLQEELGVNLEGLEVALHLMEVIREERREFAEVLAWLRDRIPGPGA